MKIPFVGSSDTARSINAACERTVNLYLEKNPAPGRELVLYGTPGLTLRETLASGAHRGCVYSGGYAYFVAGSHVYRMDSNYAVTDCGAIGTSSGRVGITTNGTEVLIVDGAAGWLVTGTTLAQIVDVDFPNGVTKAKCLDGFFLVFGDGTQRLYWNETPNAGTNWNGLDFGSAEGKPDTIIDGEVANRELVLFGENSTEVWINTGDADQPFQRSGNAFVEMGAAGSWTACTADNSVFWLGSNEAGDGIVFRLQGYTPARISDHALETAIAGYGTISDAYAYSFQMAGHYFYVLTFPTADATWLYDASTQRWTEWLWRNGATNEFHRHRSACHVFLNRKHLVGDWENGKVYSLEPAIYTDSGDTIKRLRVTQTMRGNGRGKLFFGQGEVEMETGVANADCADPKAMLRYSNDDGHSWSNEKILDLGATGEYDRRVKFGPTGATKPGKGRTWELSITDPVKVAIFGADVDVTEG